MAKFIIPVHVLSSFNVDGLDKKIGKNRFNNGLTSIIGPVDPKDVETVIEQLKKESEEDTTSKENFRYIVFDGELK